MGPVTRKPHQGQTLGLYSNSSLGLPRLCPRQAVLPPPQAAPRQAVPGRLPRWPIQYTNQKSAADGEELRPSMNTQIPATNKEMLELTFCEFHVVNSVFGDFRLFLKVERFLFLVVWGILKRKDIELY